MSPIKTWRSMVEEIEARLEQQTGEDSDAWVRSAAAAGISSEPELRVWLRDRKVTGYSQDAVVWKMFGYPEFFLKSAAELIDGQYADRPRLRPIADALLQLASAMPHVEIQARKTYVSLQSARRKFAQISPTNKTSVDLILRIEAAEQPRLEPIKVRPQDPFDHRVRLKSVDQVDEDVARLLALALEQSQ